MYRGCNAERLPARPIVRDSAAPSSPTSTHSPYPRPRQTPAPALPPPPPPPPLPQQKQPQPQPPQPREQVRARSLNVLSAAKSAVSSAARSAAATRASLPCWISPRKRRAACACQSKEQPYLVYGVSGDYSRGIGGLHGRNAALGSALSNAAARPRCVAQHEPGSPASAEATRLPRHRTARAAPLSTGVPHGRPLWERWVHAPSRAQPAVGRPGCALTGSEVARSDEQASASRARSGSVAPASGAGFLRWSSLGHRSLGIVAGRTTRRGQPAGIQPYNFSYRLALFTAGVGVG